MNGQRALIVGGLSLLLIVSGGAAATSVSSEGVQGVRLDPDSFSFRFDTPDPGIDRRPEGFDRVEIRGFGTRPRRSGVPDLPTKTFLVAIPFDADPALEVRVLGERFLPGVRPIAVDDRAFRTTPRGSDRSLGRGRIPPDARYASGEAPFPERLAWLGDIGVLRDQRYVELHLAPVRYDPLRRGLLVHEPLEIVVRFNRSAASAAYEIRPDPRFESVYRDTFVNYGQGLGFRRVPRALGAAAISTAEAVQTGPLYRILVREEGIVRLDFALLQGTGLVASDLSTWKLTNRGVQVPLQIQDDGDGILETGEWVQFWGQPLRDDPKTQLNTDIPGTPLDLFEARDFTDVNPYFLTVDQPGQPALPELAATPQNNLTAPTFFVDTVRAEVDNSFRPLGGADAWYWAPSQVAGSSRTVPLSLPGLASGTDPLTIRVNVRSLNRDLAVNPDHLTRITVRNPSSGALFVDNGAFDGPTLFLHEVDWTYSGGAQASDPLEVDLENLVGGSSSSTVVLDYIEADYRRSFAAQGDLLIFDWVDETAEFEISGLSDSSPEVYEITLAAGESVVQPTRLTGVAPVGAFGARFRVSAAGLPPGSMRRFAIVGDTAITTPATSDFVADTVSDLRDTANQADMIVIAHPDLVDQSPGQPLALWLDHRASAAGGGLTTKLAFIQDVEDEFDFGLPGPVAVREFLRWVMSDQPGEGWADPKPAYVMLIGDGSYAYKDGTAGGNFVPTQVMYKESLEFGSYASDNVMAAVVGDDQLADLVIGRIPARSLADTNVMLQKILDYEQIAPAGAWRNHALFVSDRGKLGNNPGEALDFENINASGEAFMKRPPFTSRNLRYWTDYFDTPDPNPWDSINGDLKDAVNGTDPMFPGVDGAAIVQYIGHGNFVIWSDDFFFDERINPPSDTFQDSMDLTNGGRRGLLSWMMAHNCLTGGFYDRPFNSIGENWLKLDGGGAVGVFSPTGLSFNFIGDVVTGEVWDAIFGRTKEREVARIVMRTLSRLCTQGSTEACQNYVVLGDPAMRLILRDVEPAAGLQTTSLDTAVDLSWTASPTPGVTYDVYQATRLTPAIYTRVATGLTTTSHQDTGLVNAQSYYYYVVAVDGEGFESRWSNFNSDCAGAAIDCVVGVPLNPSPPVAPTGLTLDDPGTGNALKVSWAPNAESDIRSYTLHVGTSSGSYSTTIEVFEGNRVTLTGLIEGQDYFAVVTATNTSLLTSDPSLEASDYPVSGFGLRGPSYIDDLRIGKQGSDAVLEWTEVVDDIYGKPEAVSFYEIFRGDSPNWATAALVKIGECPSPCATFTDPGALALPGDVHYRVRAVDDANNTGGFGNEPPASTELRVARSMTPGALILDWDPVDATVAGGGTTLQHYAVYAADQPFSRKEIRDGSVPLLTTVPGTSLELTPAAQSRYYSVLAVDIWGNASPF